MIRYRRGQAIGVDLEALGEAGRSVASGGTGACVFTLD